VAGRHVDHLLDRAISEANVAIRIRPLARAKTAS
jgi:hypothetical protein